MGFIPERLLMMMMMMSEGYLGFVVGIKAVNNLTPQNARSIRACLHALIRLQYTHLKLDSPWKFHVHMCAFRVDRQAGPPIPHTHRCGDQYPEARVQVWVAELDAGCGASAVNGKGAQSHRTFMVAFVERLGVCHIC